MENASKALLIAGSVLIVILLIGVGMMIYNGATETINQSTTQMSSQQIQMQNQQYTPYEGSNVRGTKVKQLLETIKASEAAGGVPMTFDSNGTITSKDQSSTVVTSHQYTVTFSDADTDGLIDSVSIKDNNANNP